MNVITEVVEKKWCIGCGVCAAVCPNGRLVMKWNARGEYCPIEEISDGSCNPGCSLCYDVCPAHGNTKNETTIARELYSSQEGIKYRKETGYYLASYVGYSETHRSNGASGGLATWLLEELFKRNKVNTVVAVGTSGKSNRLFDFKICSSIDEIRKCSRSVYYPVEISHTLKAILKREGSYAIIALPCVCKAIRLAQDKIPHLRERIKYLVGLTCNHQCSKFFAEYICALSGGDPHCLRNIVFRGKEATQPAANHKFIVSSDQNGKEKVSNIFWWDGVGRAFTMGYFQIPGCFYCDDVFAECSDICFMDAWLPEFDKNPAGTSLSIVRSRELNEVLGYINDVKPIGISRVIASQRPVIQQKQYRRTASTTDIPVLRKEVQRTAIFLESKIIEVMKLIAESTSRDWNLCNKAIPEFDVRMGPIVKKFIMLNRLQKILRLPVRICWKIYRTITDLRRDS